MPTKPLAVIALSELEKDAASVLEDLEGSSEPSIILKDGQAAAFLFSLEGYRKAQAEREILSLLVRGEKEIAEDKGFDLEEVLAEAEKLVALSETSR